MNWTKKAQNKTIIIIILEHSMGYNYDSKELGAGTGHAVTSCRGILL
jgi:hypothetical protein